MGVDCFEVGGGIQVCSLVYQHQWCLPIRSKGEHMNYPLGWLQSVGSILGKVMVVCDLYELWVCVLMQFVANLHRG